MKFSIKDIFSKCDQISFLDKCGYEWQSVNKIKGFFDQQYCLNQWLDHFDTGLNLQQRKGQWVNF